MGQGVRLTASGIAVLALASATVLMWTAQRRGAPRAEAEVFGAPGAIGPERPDFYQEYRWESGQRSLINQAAVDKLLLLQNLAARSWAAEKKFRRGEGAVTAYPAPVTVTISEAEVNAFLQHNAGLIGFDRHYAPYLTDPQVFFRKGELILSAGVYELKCVVSARLRLELDAQSRLRVSIKQVLAGRQPLDASALAAQIARIRASLAPRMDPWKKEARMGDAGESNEATVAAAVGRLILETLDGRAVDAVAFVQFDRQGHSMPLRLASVGLEDQMMTVTFTSMDPTARAQVMQRLCGKEPVHAARPGLRAGKKKPKAALSKGE